MQCRNVWLLQWGFFIWTWWGPSCFSSFSVVFQFLSAQFQFILIPEILSTLFWVCCLEMIFFFYTLFFEAYWICFLRSFFFGGEKFVLETELNFLMVFSLWVLGTGFLCLWNCRWGFIWVISRGKKKKEGRKCIVCDDFGCWRTVLSLGLSLIGCVLTIEDSWFLECLWILLFFVATNICLLSFPSSFESVYPFDCLAVGYFD